MCFLFYLKEKLWRNIVCLGAVCLTAVVFLLYDIPGEAVSYSVFLCLAIFLAASLAEYYIYWKKDCERKRLFESVEYNLQELYVGNSKVEQDYRQLLQQLLWEKKSETQKMQSEYQELKEYIMMWAHQVKTPITALKLLVQSMEAEENLSAEKLQQIRHMKEEIFQIESYVSMNLQYIRLDSLHADLSISPCNLEAMVKAEVRKLSPFFIAKRLSVQLINLEREVVTDEKWLSFVIGQILSNAVKYTGEGGITISAEEQGECVRLLVQDTGIGIAPEDLPRIFEKAFTGFNGHVDKRATGIGLYLSKRILERLGHEISLESEVGKGTSVVITFCRHSVMK